MISPIEFIVSKCKALWIEVGRGLDHTFRQFSGLPTRKRSEITPQLFVGGQYSDLGLEKLHRREFTAIVNMRLNSFEDAAKRNGFHYLHLPTPDMTAVSLENLRKGALFIQKEIESGGRVYVHCRAGEGRGPSMAIAYLISTGLTYDDAFAQVKKVRAFIRPNVAQVKRLQEFEKKWREEKEKSFEKK